MALVGACVLGALAVAWAGRRPPDLHWIGARFESQDGSNALDLVSSGAWGGLELAVAYNRYDSSHVCGLNDRRQPLLAAAGYSRTAPRRTISTFIVNAATAETLTLWPDRWLVCPVPCDGGPSDLLLWFPEAWYESASRTGSADTIGLFQHNYATDFKLLNRETFAASLAAAARGESLAVYSRLALVDQSGSESMRFGFDPRYTADDGYLYETPDGPVAIVETDGGYANSDLFYMLLGQPRVSDGQALALLGSEDIDGSYRGCFAVDLESGAPLWYRRTGVTCLKNHMVDLDGDGIDEMLLDAYSANNGISGAGMTDSESAYVICLDQGGNVLWRKRFLGLYVGTQAAAVDVTGDGRLEVLVTWSSGYSEELGGAAVLSADGRTIHERSDLGGLYGMAVADFDGDGEVEIAASGPESRVYLLSASLEVERSVVDTTDLLMPASDPAGEYAGRSYHGCGLPWRSRSMPIAAADVDGDGVAEILALHAAWHRWDLPKVSTVLCGRGDIVAYDGQLEEVMRAPVDYRMTGSEMFPFDAPASMKTEAFPLDIDDDGVPELIVGTRGRGLFAYRGTGEN